MTPFHVVHDDAYLVVVDKSAGVLTVPTPRRERNTLVDLVAKHLRREVFVVHRLDRDTSGLLVFAKDRRTLGALVEHWSEHERIYEALAHGTLARDDGRIESKLVTRKDLGRQSSRDGRGERAVTRYRVLERVRDATLVELALETGRRNQIRVHLQELGHPILGDERYARRERPHPLWRGGLALHARRLAFTHPVTRAPVSFDAGRRADFAAFVAQASRPGRDEPRR